MHYLISPACSVKLDCDHNSVMKKSDIEHMVNSSLLYAGFSSFYVLINSKLQCIAKYFKKK